LRLVSTLRELSALATASVLAKAVCIFGLGWARESQNQRQRTECPLYTSLPGFARLDSWGRLSPHEPVLLVQEVLPVQRIPLRGAKAGVADYSSQFFFGGAVGYTGGADYVFF
jgi:hypothetical protein